MILKTSQVHPKKYKDENLTGSFGKEIKKKMVKNVI